MIWALKQEKVLNINFERGSAMDKFSNFNPKVCFLFFVFAVLLILLNFNPIFLVISLLAGVIYNAMLQCKKAFKTFFAFLLPFTILIGSGMPFFGGFLASSSCAHLYIVAAWLRYFVPLDAI